MLLFSGNFAKFGLGTITLICCFSLLTQYFLYKSRNLAQEDTLMSAHSTISNYFERPRKHMDDSSTHVLNFNQKFKQKRKDKSVGDFIPAVINESESNHTIDEYLNSPESSDHSAKNPMLPHGEESSPSRTISSRSSTPSRSSTNSSPRRASPGKRRSDSPSKKPSSKSSNKSPSKTARGTSKSPSKARRKESLSTDSTLATKIDDASSDASGDDIERNSSSHRSSTSKRLLSGAE